MGGPASGEARRSRRAGGRRPDVMDAIEALMTTRAIRRFTDEPVSDEEIATCLRAAAAGAERGQRAAAAVRRRDGRRAQGRAGAVVPRRLRPLRGVAARSGFVPRRGPGGLVAAHPRRQPAPRRSPRRGRRAGPVPAADHPVDAERRGRRDGHRPARRQRLPGRAELLRRRAGARAGHRARRRSSASTRPRCWTRSACRRTATRSPRWCRSAARRDGSAWRRASPPAP